MNRERHMGAVKGHRRSELGLKQEERQEMQSDTLKSYIAQLAAEQIHLSKTEEREYIREFQRSGDRNIRDKVIKNNLLFVVHMCKNKFKYNDPFELISVGNKALIDSIGKFNCDEEVDFRTYVGTAINRALVRHEISQDGLGISNETRRLRYHVNKVLSKVELETGDRNISSKEVAKMLNEDGIKINKKIIMEHDVDHVRQMDGVVSFNTKIQGTELVVGDIVEDPRDLLEAVENREVIRNLSKNLTDQEKEVIYLRYFKDLTLEIVGNLMGYSKQNINLIELRAIRKMRAAAHI